MYDCWCWLTPDFWATEAFLDSLAFDCLPTLESWIVFVCKVADCWADLLNIDEFFISIEGCWDIIWVLSTGISANMLLVCLFSIVLLLILLILLILFCSLGFEIILFDKFVCSIFGIDDWLPNADSLFDVSIIFFSSGDGW